jgi:heme-degrading monooxygenase HmoA
MFFVHVDLNGAAPSTLEKTYQESFVPAISSQQGFVAVDLLRSYDEDGSYRLTIAFSNRDLQQIWVASELHQQVWSQIEACCTGYSVKAFTSQMPRSH